MKAKSSPANFNYVKSSGDAGSFAASRAQWGPPFPGGCHPPAPVPVVLNKGCGQRQWRRWGAFLIVLLCCASSGTAQDPGSRTHTVSMVSAHPISVLGYKTTQQAHFLVSASFCRTNSSKEEKKSAVSHSHDRQAWEMMFKGMEKQPDCVWDFR